LTSSSRYSRRLSHSTIRSATWLSQAAATSERDNPLLKNMTRLEIPEGYPDRIYGTCRTSTLDFCRSRKDHNPRPVCSVCARALAGGDRGWGFPRAAKCTLARRRTSAGKVPSFPPRTRRGLHLIEALAQQARNIPEDQRTLLLTKPAFVNPSIRETASRLATYFSSERMAIRTQVASGAALSRSLVVINDPPIEALVTALLLPHVKSDAPVEAAPVKRGWFNRLFKK
jgi:hypothetical protein